MDGSTPAAGSLIERYIAARAETMRICAPLEIEDYVVQPIREVSPPKWHLGHTSWFFDRFVLQPQPGHHSADPLYELIFNSYYKSAGPHWLQAERGHLSRPTVKEIAAWRSRVDDAICSLLERCADPHVWELTEAGIHHEQQHQELLLMDIKYILASNPSRPPYGGDTPYPFDEGSGWQRIESGIHLIGADSAGFAYDNEHPRHRVLLEGCEISRGLVRNAEFLEFMRAGGYEDPLLWQSKGWDWVRTNGIRAPLYWFEREDTWFEYQLSGPAPLAPEAPVMHVSWFEADAFSRWRGCRLPTEEEYEVYLLTRPAGQGDELWCWTGSSYRPYPGYTPFPPPLGEYNGKFMCDQFVLRGGSFATPRGHLRPSYRNFFEPGQRWMFSGIRLARD
jgi:ergothioneine biosynthesis protein EgtB